MAEEAPLGRILGLLRNAVAAKYGDQAAADAAAKTEAIWDARERTVERRAVAEAIGTAQAARGAGAELEADRAPERPEDRPEDRPKIARGSRRGRAERKRAQRQTRRLRDSFQRQRKRDGAREVAQAERAAEKALETHGIRHHYRPLPKAAWFLAYMAGCDRNGALALRALESINMPAARREQVLRAAFAPEGYQPTRDVCRGLRADQQRFELQRRAVLERPEEHPGAVRVIQCAIFLWLAKSRTRRRGYSYRVRGFGRGLFASMCGCGKDAVAGHTRGMPGALVALKQAGFVEYAQPPATAVSDLDRGPSGHAYAVYWFRSSVAELELEAMHRHVADAARLPFAVQAWTAASSPNQQAPPRPPPAPPPEEIPF